MSNFNVAILGAGKIARSMAEALRGIKEEVNMYAVASRSLEKAEVFAAEQGFEVAYGSYEDLAKDENVDLIYVATPHSEHYANTRLCIEHGRNCIVEKAFCGNRKQAAELIKLAEKKKVFLAEAMWTRYQPTQNIIRDIINSGKLGQLHYMESDFSIPIKGVDRVTNPALAGGSLLDLGIYSITVPVMYYGTDIKCIKTSCIKFDTGVDATMEMTFTYKDGFMAKAKSSAVDDHSNFARITGDKGYVEFGPINVPNYVKVYDINGNLMEDIRPEYIANGYEYEILESKKCIEEGKLEPDSLPWAESLRMMGWMDSLRNHHGIIYPFESAEDIRLSDLDVWGVNAVYDDTNPWDRSNTRSYLEVYNTEDGSTETLASFEYVIEAPNWSHDGKFLTYNSEGLIYKFDLASKESTKIYSGNLNRINNDHVLASDDSAIAVSDESYPDGKSRISIVPLYGEEPVLVTKAGPSYLHGWTPDKKTFAYCAERGGEYDVYTINADGSNETRLTTAPRLNDGCEFDSEGEYIYFNSVRTGLMQAWKMKADGTEQTQLTTDADLNTWFPHISPDRTKIVMLSYYKGDLWPGDHIPNRFVELRYMNADGTGLKTLLKFFGGQGSLNVNSWDPESRKFAFVRYEKM